MLNISVDTEKTKPEIIITYGDRQVSFCASVFQRKQFQKLDVFEPANAYLARMGMAEQDALWKIYEDVYNAFGQIFGAEDLFEFLNTSIKKLADLIPLRQLETWISIDPGFLIPSDIMDKFIQDEERKNSREKTYLRSDYIKLLALAVLMRFLMPILGEFIDATRRNIGGDFKEYAALELLVNTGILESEAIAKLSSYINLITKEKQKNEARILAGTSSEDMGFYLLALVLVHKLSTSDVRGFEEGSNLAAKVYVYLIQRMFSPDKSDLPIRDKAISDSRESSDQNRRSQLESYRKREEISIGDRAGIAYGYEDLIKTAMLVAPGISEDAVMASVNTASLLAGYRNGLPQETMMAWVFKHVHSPNSPGYIKKHLLVQNLGVLEAVLWHWGFPYLAILATSYVEQSEEAMHVTAIDNRSQIPEEYKSRILQLFPHTWSNLRRNQQGTTEEPNPVLHAIDLVVDDLLANSWRATASDDKIREVFKELRRKTPIFPTIKTELARLLIYIEDRYSDLSIKRW